jgi:hypothetical protein
MYCKTAEKYFPAEWALRTAKLPSKWTLLSGNCADFSQKHFLFRIVAPATK